MMKTGIVARHSFAGILNNMIGDILDAGIRMLDGSSARIGFMELAQSARGNAIRRRARRGCSSTAHPAHRWLRMTSATLTGLGFPGGVHPMRTLQGLSSDRVAVTQNCFVQLGDLPGLLSPPNDTTAPNMGFGLSCSLNSSVDGQLGR